MSKLVQQFSFLILDKTGRVWNPPLRIGIPYPAPLAKGAIKSDAHNRAACEIALGVQGLPCLYIPPQGKPCTPASLFIAPPCQLARDIVAFFL
ncbi:MAG: hypothetical protein DM484_11370 [Candidatus Methylumidiphilus alinenensis]|uniref:Uncharacterized protein n=1 Tax=Candidatus Methylumidiphilus alinenensis TaxID=2202197 RepID=A0A2W4R5H6_9GAMM|nr:MAG: hypothetical protein DM484_11370 [Candidatus Methylumidiphilus alinenensis]